MGKDERRSCICVYNKFLVSLSLVLYELSLVLYSLHCFCFTKEVIKW